MYMDNYNIMVICQVNLINIFKYDLITKTIIFHLNIQIYHYLNLNYYLSTCVIYLVFNLT